MAKVQPINGQLGSLLAEWMITISLVLLLISIALPLVTTPSRYTLNGATQEVVYIAKKGSCFGPCLVISRMGKVECSSY